MRKILVVLLVSFFTFGSLYGLAKPKSVKLGQLRIDNKSIPSIVSPKELKPRSPTKFSNLNSETSEPTQQEKESCFDQIWDVSSKKCRSCQSDDECAKNFPESIGVCLKPNSLGERNCSCSIRGMCYTTNVCKDDGVQDPYCGYCKDDRECVLAHGSGYFCKLDQASKEGTCISSSADLPQTGRLERVIDCGQLALNDKDWDNLEPTPGSAKEFCERQKYTPPPPPPIPPNPQYNPEKPTQLWGSIYNIHPVDITSDDNGNAYFADYNRFFVKIDSAGKIVSEVPCRYNNGSPCNILKIDYPGDGRLYLLTSTGKVIIEDVTSFQREEIQLNISSPGQMALDPWKNEMYISDNKTAKVSVYDLKGNFKRTMNEVGKTLSGGYYYINDLAIDRSGDGTLFVAFFTSSGIDKANLVLTYNIKTGQFLGNLNKKCIDGNKTVVCVAINAPISFDKINNTLIGYLNDSLVSMSGWAYTSADLGLSYRHVDSITTSNGSRLYFITDYNDDITALDYDIQDTKKNFVKWDLARRGERNGYFRFPTQIAVQGQEAIVLNYAREGWLSYAVDFRNTANGIQSKILTIQQVPLSQDIAYSSSGDIYFSSYDQKKVIVLSQDGKEKGKIDISEAPGNNNSGLDNIALVTDTHTTSLAIDKYNNLYASNGFIVLVYDSNNKYLKNFARYEAGQLAINKTTDEIYILNTNISGNVLYKYKINFQNKVPYFTKTGEFSLKPYSSEQGSRIATNSKKDIFITFPSYNMVIVFDSNGNPKYSLGKYAEHAIKKAGEFSQITDIAIDSNDVVYVTDDSNVHVFK